MNAQKLIEMAHKRQAARINASFKHLGWSADEKSVASKLQGGLILVTVRLAKGKYQHSVCEA